MSGYSAGAKRRQKGSGRGLRGEAALMREFELKVEIKEPIALVFAYLTDPEQLPIWSAQVGEARVMGGGGLKVGSQLCYRGKFLGRFYEVTASCTKHQPNSRFATRTSSGPFHLWVDSRLTETDHGTLLRTRYRGESLGFFKLSEELVVRLTRRQFQTNLEALKELLEADPAEARGS